MFRPDQSSLTQAAAGRVSMPFLPTLAVVTALGIASLYCPSSQTAAPEPVRAAEAPAPSPTAFAPASVAEAPPARLPAAVAFAAQYPISPVLEASAVPTPRAATRPNPHLAVVARRGCQGRRCPETPHNPDPLAAARAEVSEPEDGRVPARALPFVDTVAETLAPAARVVGEAADLVRGGAVAVTGSVTVMAECLR